MYFVNAAETHETFYWESGMRYQSRRFRPDPRSDRAFVCLGNGRGALIGAGLMLRFIPQAS
jgi:hypothetical protein